MSENRFVQSMVQTEIQQVYETPFLSSIFSEPSRPTVIDLSKFRQLSIQSPPQKKQKAVISPLNQVNQNILFLYQMLGTFLFVEGQLHVNQNIGIHLHIALLLTIYINVCAPICGANFNTSVTMAFCFCKFNRYNFWVLWLYFKTQFYSALVGIFCGYMINQGQMLAAQIVTDNISISQIIMSQLIGTFMLIFFIFLFTNPQTNIVQDSPTVCTNFLIILLVFVARRFAIYSYYSINPSITLANAVSHVFINLDLYPLQCSIYFVIGDLLGIFLALISYDYYVEVRRQVKRQKEKDNNKRHDIQLQEKKISQCSQQSYN